MPGVNLDICVCQEQDKTKGFGKVQAAQQDLSKRLHNLTTTRYLMENWKSVTRLLPYTDQKAFWHLSHAVSEGKGLVASTRTVTCVLKPHPLRPFSNTHTHE